MAPMLAQTTTTVYGAASGAEPSGAGAVVFLVVCLILALGGVAIFVQAKRRQAGAAVDRPAT